MSTSSPLNPDASEAVRRASGRVRKQPEMYTSSPSGSGKRKRSNEEDGDGDVQMPEDYVSDDDLPSEEDEPDQEELREQNRRSRKAKTTAQKKPAPKKPKVNGASLPIRSAAGGGKKKAPRRARPAVNQEEAEEAGGLYAQVFASDDDLESVAADWLRTFKTHESQALADLVNFVLRCAGCSLEIEDHDVEDPDRAPSRLGDIQKEYQDTAPTDFPLIAKGKAGVAFKETLSGFLNAVIKTIASDGVLYSNDLLIDNVETWLSTMSSAGSRAFRHTATVAALSIMSALAEVAAERLNEAAASKRQSETEGKKAKANKGRVRQIQQSSREATQAQQFIEQQLKDWLNAVFIHRYRDVDPVIRRECMTALGDWIMILPDFYFDGQHLRYLGWVLSDTNATTRGEVLKQLQRLYKEENKIGGLRTFTERFRVRMVEIAMSDAESNVRASGIELLDLLREHGLLEPNDVDAVGRLIYDSDARVRKTVANFFAENVKDLYNSKVDDLGGLEGLEEVLPEIGEGNFESPRLEWLTFKALAEMMVAYDFDEGLPNQVERNRGDGRLTLHASAMDSRFTLAADALYDKIDDMKDWEALTGYVLFDHSTGRANGVANDTLSQLKHECVLTEKEEVVLLEVVSASVKRTIVDIAEKKASTKSRLTKKQKDELSEEQEEAARHLATLIPKLLKKFGDMPTTAAAVLRLEAILNLPSLQDLHQDSVTYGTLLDDIRKQFMWHSTDEVLGPASEAILHAKSYGELDDLTEEKLGGLWEDVINNMAELLNPATITTRGASRTEELMALSNNLLRIIRLAQISDCSVGLEDSSVATSNEASGADYQGAIDYVIALVGRAVPSNIPAIEAGDAELEDEIAARASEAVLRYFQWKIKNIISTTAASAPTDIPWSELEALAARRDEYPKRLHEVLQNRKDGEAVCITLSGHMLDLHSTAVVMRSIKLKPGMRDDWDVLIMDVSSSYLRSIMRVFSAAEKNFARLTNKKLEEASTADDEIDAEPMDEDPESESESEDDDEPTQTQASQLRRDNKQRQAIFAEQKLCELTRCIIYAIHAGVMDSRIRQRLERNKMKIGGNFKEMLSYLDIGKAKKNTKSKAKAKKPVANGVATKSKPDPKSNAIVAEDEMDDEIDDADGDAEQMQQRGTSIESEV